MIGHRRRSRAMAPARDPVRKKVKMHTSVYCTTTNALGAHRPRPRLPTHDATEACRRPRRRRSRRPRAPARRAATVRPPSRRCRPRRPHRPPGATVRTCRAPRASRADAGRPRRAEHAGRPRRAVHAGGAPSNAANRNAEAGTRPHRARRGRPACLRARQAEHTNSVRALRADVVLARAGVRRRARRRLTCLSAKRGCTRRWCCAVGEAPTAPPPRGSTPSSSHVHASAGQALLAWTPIARLRCDTLCSLGRPVDLRARRH